MVELKDCQQSEREGKLQLRSCPTMAQVLAACWIQFYLPSCKTDPAMSGQEHAGICESLHLEGSFVQAQRRAGTMERGDCCEGPALQSLASPKSV